MSDVRAIHFEDDGETPNNPDLPMLVYRGAIALDGERDPAVPFERAFARHGWGDGWRNGIHAFRHFHTTAHEALGIARGRATVEFGGANGQTLTVEAGDVVVLPAGTGHRRVSSSGDLLVVGAYPLRSTVDQQRPGQADHAQAVAAIASVPVPEMDPVHGKSGPLVELWK
jgi:uncharacterized protein YjlB